MMPLTGDVSGAVNWDNVIVVGNGHAVTPTGSLVIHNSLVTGISGLSGTVTDVDIEGSIFEDSGELDADARQRRDDHQEQRISRQQSAHVRRRAIPSVPFILSLQRGRQRDEGLSGQPRRRGAAGFRRTELAHRRRHGRREQRLHGAARGAQHLRLEHHRSAATTTTTTTAAPGARASTSTITTAGDGVLTEHNFIRDSSWPIQSLAGEFRYNVVYGYGHNWLRSAHSNASIHHNIFAPGGDGGLNAGHPVVPGRDRPSHLQQYVRRRRQRPRRLRGSTSST